MIVFIYSLELLMMVLAQYGLPLSANNIALLRVFQFYIALILAILSSLQLCTKASCYYSWEEECEIGDYEHEVHYYYDLVAMNNIGKLKPAAAAAA